MRAPLNFSRLPTRGPQVTPVEFNARSKALLAGVNPTLAELMYKVEAQRPDAFEISEGMRAPERQAELVAAGKSQTYNSKHLKGNAVDIAIVGPNGQPNWNFEDYRPIADLAKATAAAMGIPDFVWGGDWKTLRDGVHFQVGGPGVSPTGAGAPKLSFGPGVAAAPTDMAGIAGMFGGGGLSMGTPVDPFAATAQRAMAAKEQKRDEEEAAQIKRQALLSGVGAMFG